MGDRSYAFDAANVLSDGAVALTATNWAQNAGADGIIDLGGNQTTVPLQQARIDAALVMFITGLDTVTGDENYEVWLVGSNDPAFGAASTAVLAGMTIGGIAGKTTVGVPNTILDTTGMYEVSFTNEQANVKYQYLKLRVVITGTTPSIQMLAYIAEIPRT